MAVCALDLYSMLYIHPLIHDLGITIETATYVPPNYIVIGLITYTTENMILFCLCDHCAKVWAVLSTLRLL